MCLNTVINTEETGREKEIEANYSAHAHIDWNEWETLCPSVGIDTMTSDKDRLSEVSINEMAEWTTKEKNQLIFHIAKTHCFVPVIATVVATIVVFVAVVVIVPPTKFGGRINSNLNYARIKSIFHIRQINLC